ncbi:MAG: ADP-ribosylglycohydrolase family protein [Coleofasciculus chthonoplastes F3-SA18-01]
METSQSQVLAGLLGVCVGDALGVPVEFTTRIARGYPFNEVRGRGIAENARGQSPKYFQSLSFYLSIPCSGIV